METWRRQKKEVVHHSCTQAWQSCVLVTTIRGKPLPSERKLIQLTHHYIYLQNYRKLSSTTNLKITWQMSIGITTLMIVTHKASDHQLHHKIAAATEPPWLPTHWLHQLLLATDSHTNQPSILCKQKTITQKIYTQSFSCCNFQKRPETLLNHDVAQVYDSRDRST